MAFDREAFLAQAAAPVPAPGTGGFDRAAFLAQAAEVPEEVGPLKTFALNATNVFGTAPAISGALNYMRGGDYTAGRDSYRAQIEEANAQNPKAAIAGKIGALVPETVLGGAVGKVAAAGAEATGLAAKVAPLISKNPILANALKSAAGGAAYGGASGAGEALSEGKDVLEGATEGAEGGAVIGGALGTVGGVVGKAVKKVAAAAETKIVSKVAEEAQDDVIKLLRKSPDIQAAAAKGAKEAIPLIEGKIAALEPAIQSAREALDGAGGKVTLGKFGDAIDAAVSDLKKKPLQEKYVAELERVRKSVIETYAPDVAEALGTADAKESELLRKNLLKRISGTEVPVSEFAKLPDAVLEDGGKAAQVVADHLRGFVDSHIADVAKKSPEAGAVVENLRKVEREYAALKNIADAIGSGSAEAGEKGAHGIDKLLKVFTHHGPVGAAIAAASGHPGPALALAAPAAAKYAAEAAAMVQRAAEAGNANAKRAIEAARAVRTVGTAGAGSVGQVQAKTLSQQEEQQ